MDQSIVKLIMIFSFLLSQNTAYAARGVMGQSIVKLLMIVSNLSQSKRQRVKPEVGHEASIG